MYLNDLIEFIKTKQSDNRDELRNNTNDPKTVLKIRNFIKKHSLPLDVQFVQRLIRENDVVAATFAKDALKQNLIENFISNYIMNNFYGVAIVKVLPKSGQSALYVDKGQIRFGSEYVNNDSKPSKSIDFKIELNNGKTIYVAHKYTSNKGGHQDNQRDDAIKFIKNANGGRNEYPNVIALLDGPYWTDEKLSEVGRWATNNTRVLNGDRLQKFINELL